MSSLNKLLYSEDSSIPILEKKILLKYILNTSNEEINISHNNQIIFGISGCDSIVSKNNIWYLLNSKYGRIKASTLMPNTYIICLLYTSDAADE